MTKMKEREKKRKKGRKGERKERKKKRKQKDLNKICFGIRTEFLTIYEMALNILWPFCTMCSYEMTFSALMFTKSLY